MTANQSHPHRHSQTACVGAVRSSPLTIFRVGLVSPHYRHLQSSYRPGKSPRRNQSQSFAELRPQWKPAKWLRHRPPGHEDSFLTEPCWRETSYYQGTRHRNSKLAFDLLSCRVTQG